MESFKASDEGKKIVQKTTRDVSVEVINQRIDKAFDFYEESGFSAKDIKKHLKGIDFSKSVEVENLSKDQSLSQWQVPGNWRGTYYSEIGEIPTRLGINPYGKSFATNEILKREAKLYKLAEDVSLLKSTANDILDDFSIPEEPFQTEGGGIQYFTTNKDTIKEVIK